MTFIESLSAREVLDSRGNPTIEVTCELESGAGGPGHRAVRRIHGVLRGRRAARRRRRFGGKGVLKAVGNVNGEIAAAVCGLEALRPGRRRRRLIELDGTAEQGPARRQRHPRRVARRAPGPPPTTRAAALPLPRRRRRARPAGAA